MRNKSEQARVLFITLFLAILCLVPFVIAPLKDWYVILILFGVPALSILAFGLLSNKFSSVSNPKRLWNISYFVVGSILFFTLAAVLYLNSFSWFQILLYSAGFSVVAVVLAMISIFIWSKIKQSNPTSQE